jgi:hypothetical protein
MIQRIKSAAVFTAMAAICALTAGGAGAAGSNAPLASTSRSAASTAAAQRAALLRHADFSTIAGAKAYFSSIGVNPRGVVIQRGVHNYAGPSCPGASWSCTSTAHPVVQVARRGGKNRFLCTTGSCAVVQATTSANKARSLTAALVTNTAKCIKTTGVTQACSISQTNATADNVAIVVEITTKASGLTQTASHTAQITQQATGASNSNTACVLQDVAVDGTTNAAAKKGVPVTVTLNAHGSISVVQDAHGGPNTVKGSTAAGDCAVNSLTQKQTLTSSATGSASVAQNQNATDAGANVLLDIEQNQSTGFFGSATGSNDAAFSQTSTLTAIANTQAGPVNQTQSSPSGGILAKINQFSHGVSTAKADQQETQCLHAQTSGATTCTSGTPPGYSLTQKQFGPIGAGGGRPKTAGRTLAKVGKGGICPPDCSTQVDNPGNTFLVNQTSTQSNDTGQDQTNDVQGDCRTSGPGCTVNQTTTVQTQTTTNSQTAQTVSTSITCSGSTCTKTPPIVFDGSPGTNAPPATLGPYAMTKFGADPQPTGTMVTGVTDPAGTLTFSQPLIHSTVGNGWATWSHGYTGDVYSNVNGSPITITLPGGTRAFYLYAEPNAFALFNVTATAQDGTTSGPVSVQGEGGAAYFGFYATGTPNIATITVTTTDTTGLGVGEFGISPTSPPPPIG